MELLPDLQLVNSKFFTNTRFIGHDVMPTGGLKENPHDFRVCNKLVIEELLGFSSSIPSLLQTLYSSFLASRNGTANGPMEGKSACTLFWQIPGKQVIVSAFLFFQLCDDKWVTWKTMGVQI